MPTSYNPYKWPYKQVAGVITPINGVITLLTTGRAPPCICIYIHILYLKKSGLWLYWYQHQLTVVMIGISIIISIIIIIMTIIMFYKHNKIIESQQ